MTVMRAFASEARPGGVVDALRAATAASHHRLEIDLDIDEAIGDRARMRRLLERFWGFHKVWEPAAARAVADDAFTAPRRKLALLEADLRNLGRSPDEIEGLPVCQDAAPLPGLTAAIGSYYVLEGSTLGGQVITRRLKAAGWADGLRYFDPYGDETGALWRAFRARAETCEDKAAVTASAVRTFKVLRSWLIREEQP